MGWIIAAVFIGGCFVGGVASFGFGFVRGWVRATAFFTNAGAEALKAAQAAQPKAPVSTAVGSRNLN